MDEKEQLVMALLDEIGEALREKGITLDEMMECGREIRGELYREIYGGESPDDREEG